MALDINSLVSTTINEPNSTAIKAADEGEYTLMIMEPRDGEDVSSWIREVNTKNGTRYILRVPFKILDEDVQQKVGRETVVARMDIWLDMDGDALSTKEGDNTKLGQLRKALGKNDGPFSFNELPGAGPVKGYVTVDSNPNDPEIKYNGVQRVVAMS